MQRHLDEPRTGNRVLNEAKSPLEWARESNPDPRARYKGGPGVNSSQNPVAWFHESWILEIRRKIDVAVRNVKAWMVADVEHLRAIP